MGSTSPIVFCHAPAILSIHANTHSLCHIYCRTGSESLTFQPRTTMQICDGTSGGHATVLPGRNSAWSLLCSPPNRLKSSPARDGLRPAKKQSLRRMRGMRGGHSGITEPGRGKADRVRGLNAAGDESVPRSSLGELLKGGSRFGPPSSRGPSAILAARGRSANSPFWSAGDLPVSKREKRSLREVAVNGGLHYAGVLLVPPVSRAPHDRGRQRERPDPVEDHPPDLAQSAQKIASIKPVQPE
jgi:hypothetical protein